VQSQRSAEIRPWMLFAFPAAIVVPIVAGLLLGGPAVGFGIAVLVALIVVVVAVRMKPRGQDGTPERPTGEEPDWRRAAARRFALPLLIAVAGIVVVAVASGTTRAIGWGVVALAITVAMSLVFLEIGYSEDRARAREDRDPTARRTRRRGTSEPRPPGGRSG
jgi:hypothetical protein